MTATSKRTQTKTTNASQTSLTGIAVASGDLIVVTSMGGDSNPGPVVTPTNCTVDTLTNHAQAFDPWPLSANIWSARVTSVTGSPATVQVAMTTWTSAGGRRFTVTVADPGSGNRWGSVASRVVSYGTLIIPDSDARPNGYRQLSNITTSVDFSARPTCAFICGFLSSGRFFAVDFDVDFDEEHTGDEGLETTGLTGIGGGLLFDGYAFTSGVPQNQTHFAADGYWDGGDPHYPNFPGIGTFNGGGPGVNITGASGGIRFVHAYVAFSTDQIYPTFDIDPGPTVTVAAHAGQHCTMAVNAGGTVAVNAHTNNRFITASIPAGGTVTVTAHINQKFCTMAIPAGGTITATGSIRRHAYGEGPYGSDWYGGPLFDNFALAVDGGGEVEMVAHTGVRITVDVRAGGIVTGDLLAQGAAAPDWLVGAIPI